MEYPDFLVHRRSRPCAVVSVSRWCSLPSPPAATVSGGALITGGQFIVEGSGNVAGGVTVGNGSGAATLVLDGLAAGNVTIDQDGTLNGHGTAGAVLVQGSTLAVGNSVDELTINGIGTLNNESLLKIDADSTIVFEFLDATGDPGTGWDFVDLTSGGTLNLNGVGGGNRIHLNIVSLLPDNSGPGAAAHFNLEASGTYSWLFIQADNLTGVTMAELNADYLTYFAINDAGVFAGDDPFHRPLGINGQPATFGVEWRVGGSDGSGLYISFTAVPEPGSMILTGLGSLAAAWYGRRKLRKNNPTAATEAQLAS